MNRLWLWVEFVALFVALPIVLIVYRYTVAPRFFPILITIGIYCFVQLWRDPTFDRASFLRRDGWQSMLKRTLVMLAIGGSVLGGILYWVEPRAFLFLPRNMPGLWSAVILIYPIASVLPQGIIFRSFFFHRYRELFPARMAQIAVSALVFGFAHAFLGNWIAPALATVGGFLFAVTYARTRSGILASLEHALWGDALFTLGVGWWFYGGSIGSDLPPG